jgi:hypothetical protein
MMNEDFVGTGTYYKTAVEQPAVPTVPVSDAQIVESSAKFEAWLASVGWPACKRPRSYPAVVTFYKGKASTFTAIEINTRTRYYLAIQRIAANYAHLVKAEPNKRHRIILRGSLLTSRLDGRVAVVLADQDVTDLVVGIAYNKVSVVFNPQSFINAIEDIDNSFRNQNKWSWSIGLEIVTSR